MFLCDFVWYWRCFQTKKLKKWMMEIKRTSWSLSDMSMNLNAEQTQNSVRGREDDLFDTHVVMRRTVVWRWNLVPHQTDSITFQKSQIRGEKLSLILSLKRPLFPFFTQPSLAYFCHMYTQSKHYEQSPGRTFRKCVPLSLYLHD